MHELTSHTFKIFLVFIFLFIFVGVGCAPQKNPPTPLSATTNTTKTIRWCDNTFFEMNTFQMTDTQFTSDKIWISSEDFNGMNHAPSVKHVCRGHEELFFLQMVWDESASPHTGALISKKSETAFPISSEKKDPDFALLPNQEEGAVLFSINEKKFVYHITNDIFEPVTILDQDWLTYTSNKGFEINYPSNWAVTENAGGNMDLSVISLKNPETKDKLKDPQGDINIYYYPSIADEPENKLNNLGATTLEEFISKNPTIKKINSIKIGDLNGVSVIWNGFGTYYTVLLMNDSGLYKIQFSDADELTSTEKTILYSFKLNK